MNEDVMATFQQPQSLKKHLRPQNILLAGEELMANSKRPDHEKDLLYPVDCRPRSFDNFRP